ncbi:hypothetical protein CCO03_11545 [Comamonas serinivorans]|uniref:Pseudouridine synthase n=1 Tax=Comamonas serinivorans TaxID=1082851 RepID=A0A1Y0EP70_9BURK|nr:pseudouridine synthase [Comamonas serinivorans]ARU05230.1 hypothetical protein CCO03_11545 [Comamonas serinivorans]
MSTDSSPDTPKSIADPAASSDGVTPTPPSGEPPQEAAPAKRRRGPAARRAEAALRGPKPERASQKKRGYSQVPIDGSSEGSDTLLDEVGIDDADADEWHDESSDDHADEAAAQPRDWDAFSAITSGAFDKQAASTQAPKRVLAPQADAPKLHKVLAQAGMGSRLEMERLITEGRISVNNEPAHVGQRIQFGDVIKVNGKPVRVHIAPPPARVIAYHKPEGEVVSHNDPQNRPTVFRSLPRLPTGKWQSVGRLDLNTEGLLLFTNSGSLANRLMHPRFGLQRQYAVRVLGALSDDEKQRLLDGVQLEDGPAQFSAIEDGGGEGANQWYRVTISEGRNREVRRMMEAVGHAVSRLIRIRYGAMLLPRGLRRGHWMELDHRDIRALTEAVGLPQVGHEVPAHVVRKAQEVQSMRNKRGRNADRSGRGGGPRPSSGPLSQRDQRMVQARDARIQNARDGFTRPDREARGEGPGDEFVDRRVAEGRGRRAPGQAGRGRGAGGQPDPLRTSQGYIGADSFFRQRKNDGPRSGGGGRSGGGRTGGGRSGGGRGRR